MHQTPHCYGPIHVTRKWERKRERSNDKQKTNIKENVRFHLARCEWIFSLIYIERKRNCWFLVRTLNWILYEPIWKGCRFHFRADINKLLDTDTGCSLSVCTGSRFMVCSHWPTHITHWLSTHILVDAMILCSSIHTGWDVHQHWDHWILYPFNAVSLGLKLSGSAALRFSSSMKTRLHITQLSHFRIDFKVSTTLSLQNRFQSSHNFSGRLPMVSLLWLFFRVKYLLAVDLVGCHINVTCQWTHFCMQWETRCEAGPCFLVQAQLMRACVKRLCIW